jgi:hypothetical protein
MGNALPGPAITVSSLPVYVTGQGISAEALRAAFERAAIVPSADPTPPSLSIDIAPTGPVTAGVPIQLRWSATDAVAMPSDATPQAVTYSYRLVGNGRPATWSAWSAVNSLFLSNLSPGTYSFQVRARDTAGRQSAPASRPLTITS